MTRQLFWIGLGATAGVLVYRRAARAAESLRPENLAHSAAEACLETGYSVREFMTDLREGMELRQQAYADAARERAARPALPAGGPPGAPRALELPGPRVPSAFGGDEPVRPDNQRDGVTR